MVSMNELEPYPYVSFEQGDHNSFYFSEEIFSTVVRPKHIRVRDRASLFSLLIGLNGYTVSSGVIDKEFNGESIISVPLAEEGIMHIGYITNNKMQRSRLGQGYINALEQYVNNYGKHIQLPTENKSFDSTNQNNKLNQYILYTEGCTFSFITNAILYGCLHNSNLYQTLT